MGMVAILAFIEEPAVCPDLGGPQNLLAGPQNNPHRFIVEYERKGCHAHEARQNSCRHVTMLSIYMPTRYSFDGKRESQSDTFNEGCAVSS